MRKDPAEEPGQAPEASSSAAQLSAPPANPDQAETSNSVEPDENTREDDQKPNPDGLPDDKKDEIHGVRDADISSSRDKEADDAFNRLSELLQDGEVDEKSEDDEEREDDEKDEYDKEVLGKIREIGNKWPELLDRGMRFHGYNRVTALHLAIYRNLPETFDALIEVRKPLLKATNDNLQTPLHIACWRGRLDMVKKLVVLESDVNAQDTSLRTPLQHACEDGHLEIVQFLLQYKADITLADTDGWTPLTTAVVHGYQKIAELLLLEGSEINHKDDHGWSPLHHAAYDSDLLELMSWLIDKGADLNLQSNSGSTPLDIACLYGQDNIVDLLTGPELRDRTDIESRDENEWTPLITATKYGNPKIVKLLLEAGADPRACTSDEHGRWTALMSACRRGREEIVRMLLQNPGQKDDILNQTDKDGDTPLHWATRYGQVHIVDILLEEKADYSKQNNDGCTALHTACLGDLDDVAEANEGESQTENCETVSQSSAADETTDPHFRILGALLGKGADPLVKTNEDDTALHLVVEKRRLPWIAKIMEKVEPEVYSQQNKAEKTPLHIAVDRGIALDFFRAMKPSKVRESRRSWGEVEWAAAEGHPSMLWELLVRSPGASEIKDNIQRAQSLVDEILESERNPGADQSKHTGRGDKMDKKMSKGGKKTKDGREPNLRLIKDILANPPIPTSMPWEKLSPPTKPKDLHVSDGMEAVLLEFFVNKNASAFLRRDASVEDVIYTKGPQKILAELKGFLRDIKAESKFTWIHLPANNMKWMEDLTKRIWFDRKSKPEEAKTKGGEPRSREKRSEESKDEAAQTTGDGPEPKVEGRKDMESKGTPTPFLEDQFNTARWFFKTSWRALPENSSEKKFMRPVCKRLEKGKKDSEHPGDLVALYMPYLRFATECDPEDKLDRGEKVKNLRKARESHDEFLKKNKDDIVHGSRTLDEFYYQHLVMEVENPDQVDKSRIDKQDRFKKDLNDRNRNQVASRYFHGDDDGGKKPHDWDILRVDQLWMWIVDKDTIVTSSTNTFDGAKDPVLEGVLGFLRERTQDPRLHAKAADTDIQKFSNVIVQMCCGFYNEAYRHSTDRRESVRHIFSNTINDIAIRETQLFQEYRRRAENGNGSNTRDDPKAADGDKSAKPDAAAKHGQEHQNNKKEGRQTPQGNKDREEQQNNTKEDREARQKRMRKDISKATKLFYEIKDTSDELKILLSLATHQKNVQAKLLGKNRRDERKAANIVEDLNDKLQLASRIRQAVETTLTLQQSELSVEQTQAAQEQAELAYEQGRTLMAFTIVTILFLPASFCSSLFALDVPSFLESPRWAFLVIGAAFITMIVFSALLYRKTVARWPSALAKWLMAFFPEGQEKEPLSKEEDGKTENKPGEILFPDGQEKEPSSKDKEDTARNEAGGKPGGEPKPPGDDCGQAPRPEAEEYKGKEPVYTTEPIPNGDNGHRVEKVEPRWRSWFKKLLRSGHTTDRGPGANV